MRILILSMVLALGGCHLQLKTPQKLDFVK